MPSIRLLACLAALLLMPAAAAAQERPPAIVTGRITIPGSLRADSILVRIESENLGVWTDSTGRYRIVVPSRRFADGDSATLSVTRIGFRQRHQPIQLFAGRESTADFWIKRRTDIGWGCQEVVYGARPGEPIRPAWEYRRLCVLGAVLHHKLARDRILIPAASPAQRPPAVVTGRVMLPGEPRADSVLVRIESTDLATWTDGSGRFRLVIPADRFADGDSATLTAVRAHAWPQSRRIQLVAGRETEIPPLKVPRAALLPRFCIRVAVPPGQPHHPLTTGDKACLLESAHGAKTRGRAVR